MTLGGALGRGKRTAKSEAKYPIKCHKGLATAPLEITRTDCYKPGRTRSRPAPGSGAGNQSERLDSKGKRI